MSLASMAKLHGVGQNRLNPRQRERLGRLFAHRRYPKNAVVLSRGACSDVVFVVRQGSVQLSTANDRGYSIVTYHREGDFFGEDVLLGGGPSPYQATAATECELYLLDRSDLDEIGAQAPGILVKIIQNVAYRLRLNSRLYQDRSRREIGYHSWWDHASLCARIAQFLVSPSGTRTTIACFLIGVVVWGFFGQYGLNWSHLGTFDQTSFKTLTLILKLIAAFSTPLFLWNLLSIARQNEVSRRSHESWIQELQGIDDVLECCANRSRDRVISMNASHGGES